METREVMQVKELNRRASGQAFELILSPSSPEPKFPLSPMKKRETSMDEIKRKLDAAEERRKSMEAEMLKNLAEKREHMKEVIQKAIEENCNFSKTTLEKLNHKMEVNKENLDALKAASAERFKKIDQRFEDVKNKNKKEATKEASD